MAMSREARSLLQQVAGGVAGNLAGGSEGFGPGVAGASQVADQQTDNEFKDAGIAEAKRRTDINTQLALLQTPGVDNASRNAIADSIAQKTGMDPEELSIQVARASNAADMLDIIGNKNVPAAARQEAWKAFATETGLDPNVGFEGISNAFESLSPEAKQQIYEDLRDGNKPSDIDAVARWMANFNGEGDAITGPQLNAIGINTSETLSYEQRISIEKLRQQFKMTMTPRDFIDIAESFVQRQQLLGQSTMSPEQFAAEMEFFGNSLQTVIKSIQSIVGTGIDNSGNPDRRGAAHSQNMNAMRREIEKGNTASFEEAQQFLIGKNMNLRQIDKDLIKSWITKAADAAQAEGEQ